MKKFLNSKEFILSAIALLVILGFVNSLGAISMSGGLAQVFNASFLKPEIHTYYVQDNNFGAAEGITFKQNKVVTIRACGAGGGGGGGGQGEEDGSNHGSGGGGGGGGGKGLCQTRQIKVRSGDTIRWNVGTGGSGGLPGYLHMHLDSESVYYDAIVYSDTEATDGANGGTTYVSVNGVDVMQVAGGQGGQAGTNASGTSSPGWGGAGGSLDQVLQQAWSHRGDNGENTNVQWNDMGSGGYGGHGEGQNGLLSNRGNGGTSFGSNPFGGDGGGGPLVSGGGGGGGAAGRWYDYLGDLDGNELPDNGHDPNSIKSRGGMGGPGGGGYVQFYW